MRKRSLTSATMGWFLASATLAGVIAFQLNNDVTLAWPVTAAPADTVLGDEDAAAPAVMGKPGLEALDAIVERPLFTASRRPYEGPEEELPAEMEPEIAAFSLTLAGTLLRGEQRLALLLHPEKGLLRLRQGQDVDGWRIEEIRGNEVHLKREDETMRLTLQKSVSPKAPGRSRGVSSAAPGRSNDADAVKNPDDGQAASPRAE